MTKKFFFTLQIGFLIIIFLGISYSYFIAQKGNGASANIKIGADTTDSLTFQTGNAINISASSSDFYQGGEDKIGKTFALARLVPNSTTKRAQDKYNVYFIIDANDFTYSTPNKEIEILLRVKNPEGNYLNYIESLNYDEKLQGFDITVRYGVFAIALNDLIEADSEEGTTETWEFEVVLRNLSTNQKENAGKTFSGKVLITTEEKDTYIMPEINSIQEAAKTYESISVNLLENENHTAKIAKYYYAIEETNEEAEKASIMSIAEKMNEPIYVEWDKPNYTFNSLADGSPLKDNQNYKIYAYEEDEQGIESQIKTAIIKTDEYKRVKVTGFTVLKRTLNSIKIEVQSSSGNNPVKEYAFMIENHDKYGSWSNWQTSNVYEFTELADTSTYNIKVKARDELEKESIDSYDKVERTLAYYQVDVQVTGGISSPASAKIEEGTTAQFNISVLEGYDENQVTVSPSDCRLVNKILYVDNVTSPKTCTISFAKIINEVTVDVLGGNVNGGISLTNLIPNSSFEKTGWSDCIQDSTHKLSGNYSCRLQGTTDIPEVIVINSQTSSLNNTHNYYISVNGYQDTTIGDGIQSYWPYFQEPWLFYYSLSPTAKEWHKYSFINDRKTLNNGNYGIRFDYNNNYQDGDLYLDNAILIDLTADFGLNKEPSLEYLDKIPYFEDHISHKVESLEYGESSTYTISALTGYNLSQATVEGEGCSLNNDKTILTVSKATSDITCKVNIPKQVYNVSINIINGTVENGITLRNLIPNSSFENTGWNYCVYDSTYKASGEYSCKITGTDDDFEYTVNSLITIPLDNTHIYYVFYKAFQTASGGKATSVYWPIQEPRFFSAGLKTINTWNIYSAINNRSTFDNGSYPLRFDFDNEYGVGDLYIDDAMLIDLTASYGAGMEPNQASMDDGMVYFTSSMGQRKVSLEYQDSASYSISPLAGYDINNVEVTGKNCILSSDKKYININNIDSNTVCTVMFKNK